MERERTCCFTGHRPRGLPWHQDEKDLRCILTRERLALEVERAYQLGYRQFLCGMAQGIDLMAGETVIKAKYLHPDIRLEAAIPCRNQTNRWSAADKVRYEEILSQCDVVPQFLPEYTPECMMRRNRYMVLQSSRLIAVYDGISGGGTKNTVLLAMEEGLDIVLIDPSEPEK